jgi:hypothetical protein
MLSKMLDVEADEITESVQISEHAAEGQVHSPLPPPSSLTLDVRSNLYLNAVYGSRDFSSDDYAEAREILLNAMAANIGTHLKPGVQNLDDLSSEVKGATRIGVAPAPGNARLAEAPAPMAAARMAARGFLEPLLSVGDSGSARDYQPSMGSSSIRKENRSRRALRFYGTIAVAFSLIVASTAALHLLRLPSKESNTIADLSSEQLREVLSRGSTHEATRFDRTGDGSALAQRLSDLGNRLIVSGDLYGGRIVLGEAADEGSGRAALNLGSSFDPNEKAAQGGQPFDLERAKFWYQRAKQLGEIEAQSRLDRLSNGANAR